MLFRSGAEQVIAVDVGTNQLAYSLREDPRVMVFEKTNFRTVNDVIQAVRTGDLSNLI